MERVNKYYDVEKIINKRRIGRKNYYLVKWLNYPIEDCTWEPLSNLQNVKFLVENFDADYPLSVDEKMFNLFERKITSFKKKPKTDKKFLNKKLKSEKSDLFFEENEKDSLDLLKSHLYIGITPKNMEQKNEDFLERSFSKEMNETLSTIKEEIHQENELVTKEEKKVIENYFKYESNLIKPSLCINTNLC